MKGLAAAPLTAITEGHLRLLRIFRAVAEAGGLTAAEATLRMERSTISRHVQALEAKLGGRLCYRGPAGFELTELGRVALHAAITAGNALDLIRDELNASRNTIGGELHLGVADVCLTNPAFRLPAAVAAFRERAPAATLHVSIRTPAELLDGLLDRRLHIGITGTPLGNAKLRFQRLFTEEFRLYIGCPPDRVPPSLDDLQRDGYVLVTRQNDYRTLNLAKRLRLAHHAVAFGLEAVALLLASGGFVGFLPTHYVAALSHLYRFEEVPGSAEMSYETRFSLATSQEQKLPPSGQLFADLLRQAHEER